MNHNQRCIFFDKNESNTGRNIEVSIYSQLVFKSYEAKYINSERQKEISKFGDK
jgi:hypothetical protein